MDDSTFENETGAGPRSRRRIALRMVALTGAALVVSGIASVTPANADTVINSASVSGHGTSGSTCCGGPK